MEFTKWSRALVAIIASGVIASAGVDSIPDGPSLGQNPPGTTPEIFAPSIVNTNDHEGCAEFSSNSRQTAVLKTFFA
jgi:hypothetical protein